MLNSTRWQLHNRKLFTLSFIGLFFPQKKGRIGKKSLVFYFRSGIESWCSTPSSEPFIKGGCVFCTIRAHSPINTSIIFMFTLIQMNYTFLRLAAFKQLYFEASGFTFFTDHEFDKHAQAWVWVPYMACFWLVVCIPGRRIIQVRITFSIAKFHAMPK